ncbi:hypothetical protein MalM25_05370 [Planctomycetes bacterium MalM25]|nr:hypothetical protein MalM25_05370 [Planctomycetes bacterium MalM25]
MRAGLWATLLILTAPLSAQGEYLVAWSPQIARYNDSGEPLNGYAFYEETMEGIALGASNELYAIGNSLGAYPLYAFDRLTGASTTGPPDFSPSYYEDDYPWEDGYPKPLFVSSVSDDDYNPHGGLNYRITPPGCDPSIGGIACFLGGEAGRLTYDIASDHAGGIWGFGEIDRWGLAIEGPPQLEVVNVGFGLHRYRPGIDTHPTPMWRPPSQLAGERFTRGETWVLFQTPDRAVVATPFGVLDFSPAETPYQLFWHHFEDLERLGVDPYDTSDPSSPLHPSNPWVHSELNDLLDQSHSEFGEDGLLRTFVPGEDPRLIAYDINLRQIISEVSLPDLASGADLLHPEESIIETTSTDSALHVLTSRPCTDCGESWEDDYFFRRFLVFDSNTGEFLSATADTQVTDYRTADPRLIYLQTPVPEPTAAALLLVTLAGSAAPRRGANLAVR